MNHRRRRSIMKKILKKIELFIEEYYESFGH